MRIFWAFLLGCLCLTAPAAETLPPKPAHYFNDYAQVVPPALADRMNQKLEDFERATSSQVLVAVYPHMQSDSPIEDYTVRVAQSWGVGQKGKDNGAVLFVFTQDHKMFLQVGYGLEGALPDALCKRIIEDEIKPYFKAGDYPSGLDAGINAIIAATRGEYKGTGQTNADRHTQAPNWGSMLFFIIFVVILLSGFLSRKSRRGGSWIYTGGGWSSGGGSSSWGGGGGFSGGGGGFSGGGGGFSGGGGSFGGGGAGGSW